MVHESRHSPARILIVDDNPGDVRLIHEAFREADGPRVITVARDGVEALEALRGLGAIGAVGLPDLILLDLNLPRKNGREVLQQIKQTPALMRIPVLMFSSSSSPQDIDGAYREYANCFITKPADLDDFFKTIAWIDKVWLRLAKLPGPTQAARGSGAQAGESDRIDGGGHSL